MTVVRIVQLYPDELGVAGDRGNVLALVARLTAAGLEAEVIEYRRDDQLPDTADLAVIGGGPLSAMRNIYTDLLVNTPRLHEWVADGTVFFAYGSGAELLGHSVALVPERRDGRGAADAALTEGGALEGLGIFPFRARRVRDRKVGYVLADSAAGRLVGFEDNASVWTRDPEAEPLGTVVVGGGNGDGTEGVLAGQSIATQMGGPLLPLNPELTDALVSSVGVRREIDIPSSAASPLDDYARRAREVITANASHVFSRI